MTRRHIHYEAAFEDYLRSHDIPYVPVDEQKRVVFAGASVKSFDFLVYPPGAPAWLADVKGRKFPYDTPANRRTWENWVTDEDMDGLERWEGVFGPGFKAVFVFAYWITEEGGEALSSYRHAYRDEEYAFLCVPVAEYRAAGQAAFAEMGYPDRARRRLPSVGRSRAWKWNLLSHPACGIIPGMRWNVILGAAMGAFQAGVSTALAVHVAPDPEAQKPVFQWVFSLVMVGLICVIAFKNPKRSHQS